MVALIHAPKYKVSFLAVSELLGEVFIGRREPDMISLLEMLFGLGF